MQVKAKAPPSKVQRPQSPPKPEAAPLAVIPPPSDAPATRPPIVIPSRLDLDTTNPAKHYRTLYGFAVLSELSYERDEKKLRALLAKLGFDDVKLYGWDRGTVQAMVLGRGDDVFVVYRGTQETKDVFTDALSVPVRDDALTAGGEAAFAGTQIHWGVRRSRDRVWSPEPGSDDAKRLERAGLRPIVELLKDEAAKGRRISFIGHSLGGGLAAASAAALSVQKNPKTGEPILAHRVFTLGSMRTGDDAFVDAYDRRLGDRTIPVHHHTDGVRSTPKWGYNRQVAEGMTLYLPKASADAAVEANEAHYSAYYLDALKGLAEAEAKGAAGGLTPAHRLMADLARYARIPLEEKLEKGYLPNPRELDVGYFRLWGSIRRTLDQQAGRTATEGPPGFGDQQ